MIGMLPARIILDSYELVTVQLRDAQSARTVRSEAIIDVDSAGRWIHGVELLGSVDFSLEMAVKPFNPKRPGESDGVTYDKEADAAFIYFSMKPPATPSPEAALKYSHSITPNVELGFDSDGGLVWLRFSRREANKSSADFVSLINAPVEHVAPR